jgi:hypothetical protein
VLDTPALRVDVASARYLPAMKLLAARDEDVDDILFLSRLCGLRTVDEGLDLSEAAYPGKKIPVRVQYLLEEYLALEEACLRRFEEQRPYPAWVCDSNAARQERPLW